MRPSNGLMIAAAALLACTAPSAFAQTTGGMNSSQMDAASSLNDPAGPGARAPTGGSGQGMAAAQKIKQDLQSAGFTDVNVVAESFVVQAKSKDGNPVVMTIGPHGMSVFEAMGMGGATGSTGSSGSSGTVGMGTDGGGSAGSGSATSGGSGSTMSNSSSGLSGSSGSGMPGGSTGGMSHEPMQNQSPGMQK